MSAPPPDDFTDLLVAYDEALATGRAAAFRQGVAVGNDLAPRLAEAQQCLDLLAAVWPGPLPAAFGVAGQTVARFIIERELGRGGFGIVYLAHDPLLRRSVALKVPRLEGVGNTEQQRRFLQEARIAAGLAHPHIVPVYEAGEAGAVCYIASAYCPGQNLAEWLAGRQEPVPVRQAAELVATLADALAYCHARGVLHRDLKPSNVLLDEHFFPRITDFGLSKLLEASLTETRTSVILGTPLYMAPEQAGGQPDAVGPEADVYALGAILYELLTGRPPFAGASLAEVLDRIRVQTPVPPGRLRPEVPRPLETISLKCLEKEPAQRYPSAGALADDLRRHLDGAAVQARRRGMGAMVRTWTRRAERIGEAALTAFVNGSIALAAMVIGVGLVWSGRMSTGEPENVPWEYAVSSSVFSAIQFALGCFTATRHGWAIWTGVLGVPALAIYTTGMIFGFVDTGDFFSERDPAMQLILQAVAMTLLTTEFAAYLCALSAWNARGGGPAVPVPAPPDSEPPPSVEPLPTGWRRRLDAWTRRPERIGEAAILAVLNGIVGVLCTIVPALGVYTGYLPVPDPAEAAKEMLLILLYYPTMHFTLAAFTFARHGWAIKAGAVLTPLVIIWATGVIFGWVDTGDYYSGRDPAMRLMLELAAGSMLVLQAVLYAFALRAWNASQRRAM